MGNSWIRYDAKTSIPLEEWLKANEPSIVSAASGTAWIGVQSPRDRVAKTGDLVGLQEEWKNICQQQRSTIDLHLIQDLATKFDVKVGKWLFYMKTGVEVDSHWKMVAKGVVGGALGEVATSAKVSPFKSNDQSHVICVYNENFLDEDEVFKVENALRDAGILCTLKYKPDIYTHLDIYWNNKWGLRPCIYSSEYDVGKKKSSIQKVSSNKKSRST